MGHRVHHFKYWVASRAAERRAKGIFQPTCQLTRRLGMFFISGFMLVARKDPRSNPSKSIVEKKALVRARGKFIRAASSVTRSAATKSRDVDDTVCVIFDLAAS